ncbi:MAG: radical SAM protein [Magnetovibrio sp.]|nr:radical SAM protein [Magnetovibrio sp.]
MLTINGERREIIEDCLHSLKRTGQYDNTELLEGLVALGFVVSQDVDEFHREHERFGDILSGQEKLMLTIAPTMACNMRCSYCFQRDTPKTKIMSEDMQDGIIEFVRRKAKHSKHLVVQWFGGEPLIAYDAIVRMSKAFKDICQSLDLDYHAEMLTNGMHLTPDRVMSLSSLGVRAIQISLDGVPATYAMRREMPLQRAENFYKFLMDHMQAIVDATGSVTIRINVDRENIDEAKNVVDMFKRHGIIDQRLDFRLGFLNTSRGMVDCIPHDCFSNSEFAQEEHEFRKYLDEQGYMVFGLPKKRDYPCSAVLRNSYTIDPNGGIGKCVPATGTDQSMYAYIYPDDMERTLQEVDAVDVPYGSFDPYGSNSCSNCRLMPVCLGSCPKLHEGKHAFSCSMKEGLERKMGFYNDFHTQRRVSYKG